MKQSFQQPKGEVKYRIQEGNMPIYEYICKDCGVRFDALRSMKEADDPIPCRACASQHTHRTISVFNAQSGGRIVAGGGSSGCASCAGGSCASCGH
jgi:putative FmdB family regulatory protein